MTSSDAPRVDRRVGRSTRLQLVCVLAVLAPTLAWPCSVIWPPVYPLGPGEHLLYAEVTGHVPLFEPVCAGARPCSEAWGVELRIVEQIYPEGPAPETAELFSFSWDSLCTRIATSREAVEQRWPVGAKLKVSATEYVTLGEDGEPVPSPGGVLRLEDYMDGVIVRLPNDADLAAEAARMSDGHFSQLDRQANLFELRETLALLELASTPAEREEHLRKLAYYSGLQRITASGFPGLLDAYGIRERDLERLYRDNAVIGAVIGGYDQETSRLERRAAQGHVLAQFALGVAADNEGHAGLAFVWFDLAARNGYPIAEIYAGHAYRSLARDYDGEVTTAFVASAQQRFDKAAALALDLIAEDQDAGYWMLTELYLSNVVDLRSEVAEFERYVCIGARIMPFWGSDDGRRLERVERRNGRECP